MQYSNNCPVVPESFDPARPVYHAKPVNHRNMRVQDFPAACLWAQLQWERERNEGGRQYLENLETEWQRRDLCSECLREADHPFMTEVDQLRQRAERAEAKLAGINDAARLPDHAFRLAVLDILDREDGPGAPD